MSEFFNSKDNDGNPDKKEQDKLRLNLEISYRDQIIYKTEFFENVIIPSIIFEGIKTTGKKNIKDKSSKELPNINIPYSIICTVDLSEAPSWIKTDTFMQTDKNGNKRLLMASIWCDFTKK